MEWKTVKFEDTSILFIDGDRGKNYPNGNDFLEKGHCIFLNAGNVTKNGWNFKDLSYISEEKDNLLRNGKLQYRDVVLTTRGTVGNVVIYTEDVPYQHIRINSGMVIIRDNGACDAIYLYQFMRSKLFLDQVVQYQSGSAQPQLPISALKKLTFSLPDLDTQRRIAAILSSLDDKIENNNRINRNLEAQAQALFKSWFVDFEPFGGTMPEDWKKGNLLDVADLFDHKRIPLSGMQRDRMEKIYPYYGATSVMDYVDNYLYDGIYLLMGEDGSVMTDEGFPFLQYVEGKFWCNNHAHIMQGKNGYTTEMLYCLLNRTNVSGIVTGAVQGKISQASMKKIPVVLPPAKVCADMSGKLAPYFDEIRSLRQESQRLATLRDTLLPKLMKGEIEV